MVTFFESLAGDERVIELDCDVTVGYWPPRGDLDLSPDAVGALLARGGIRRALITSGQAVYYDEPGGNAEASQWAEERGWLACYAVNVRDAWGIAERLDDWLARGVRALRLPGVTQLTPASAPGYQLVVREAAARGMTMLVEGGFDDVQHHLRGLGAKVVFLDMSYYQTADFLIAARDEPGFVASTRKILGPDSLERICETVGAYHLAFGSGSPLQDLEPSVWRLRDARIPADDFAAIAGGTLTHLLEAETS